MAKEPLKVEISFIDEAFGNGLRVIHSIPGVIDIRPIMPGLGGTGPGAKRLEKAAQASAQAKANGGGKLSEAILKLLMAKDGPASVDEVVAGTGRPKSSVTSGLYILKKSGIIKSVGVGLYEMAVRPREGQVVPPLMALPAPAPGKRASHGAGPALMLVILQRHAAPLESAILRQQLQLQGVSRNSLAGIITRATRDKLVKRSGAGNKTIYELTSRGQQAAEAAAAQVTTHG